MDKKIVLKKISQKHWGEMILIDGQVVLTPALIGRIARATKKLVKMPYESTLRIKGEQWVK